MTEDSVPQQFGTWRWIGSADPTGKRSIVRCTACGCVRTVNHESLTTSHVNCSGCVPPLNVDHHARTFAADVASSEARGARGRRWGKIEG
jgi:hypothetical protein